jgi:hypothetical protein
MRITETERSLLVSPAFAQTRNTVNIFPSRRICEQAATRGLHNSLVGTRRPSNRHLFRADLGAVDGSCSVHKEEFTTDKVLVQIAVMRCT